MPELPEVETIANNIRPALVGKTILDSNLRWKRTLAMPSAARFKREIRGQEIQDISRRAKFLVLQLSHDHLIFHLRMSGDLLAIIGGYTPAKHDRLILDLSDKTKLIFHDPRKFGRAWLVGDPGDVLGGLGPEPLGPDFTAGWLYKNLQRRKRQLKPLLLDQTFIAGIGNIYADESLHMAKLHPLMRSDQISAEQAEVLWQAVRAVLEDGIRRNGASIDWVYRGGEFQNHFRVYGRGGKTCPVCGTIIERITVGQRSTHFCPACQFLERQS
jgi:formamidopyrimidine-DNA glycosylase